MGTSIYDRIKEIRQEQSKGITQTAIAKDYGVGQSSVHKWAHGGWPSAQRLREIAILENVCEEWLATGRGAKYPESSDSAYLRELLARMTESDRAEVLRYAEFRAINSKNKFSRR